LSYIILLHSMLTASLLHSLFSKFTLSSDGFNHIRIKSASLVGAESTVSIQAAREESSPAIVSTARPIIFVSQTLIWSRSLLSECLASHARVVPVPASPQGSS
jgi:hypothetical protein